MKEALTAVESAAIFFCSETALSVDRISPRQDLGVASRTNFPLHTIILNHLSIMYFEAKE